MRSNLNTIGLIVNNKEVQILVDGIENFVSCFYVYLIS